MRSRIGQSRYRDAAGDGRLRQKDRPGFYFNVILNRDGLLVDAVAGHFIKAHRVGVRKSQEVYGLNIAELADTTISCSSPVDFGFFQTDKGNYLIDVPK